MATAAVGMLLDTYRRYLRAMDAWAESWDEDRFDLLSPGEAFDVLWVRDRLDKAQLTDVEQQELRELDDLLVKYSDVIVANMPPRADVSRSHWWWYLDEGPQVREEALAAAQE
ncbi:MAG: hypothetical protein HYU88_06815 [Chloroflexi bacterium]|nr:hypothetical protein [Chloroflexota bacterium]